MASNASSKYVHLDHQFDPCFFPDSKILVLGSFPSVKSREANFYYGHPQNRFWRVLAGIFGFSMGETIEEKRKTLEHIHIALYDVIDECDIIGSSDASIKNVVPTDLSAILDQTQIRLIVLNGKKAGSLFERYQSKAINGRVPHVVMPSTSPANAAVGLDVLISEWGKALKSID